MGGEWSVRPKTIVYFEWIMFGTLLLNVLQVYLGWDAIVQVATSRTIFSVREES
jgi:hypothetical protein